MNLLVKVLFLAATFAACQNQPAPVATAPATPDGSSILKHKYWVSKPFNDALFATNVIDTMAYLPCGELVFVAKDTLLFTGCLSDAGKGSFKATSPNSLEIIFEGFEGKPATLKLDEATGVLHLTPPAGDDMGWPTTFVAQDGIDISNIDNITINLGRKRLAGQYTIVAPKGQVVVAALAELRLDGTQVGFGDFDMYEPWPSGIGGASIIEPPMNAMFFVKKGKEMDPLAVGWQLRGDTLRIWDTKNLSQEGDMPEYKTTKLRGTYVKVK